MALRTKWLGMALTIAGASACGGAGAQHGQPDAGDPTTGPTDSGIGGSHPSGDASVGGGADAAGPRPDGAVHADSGSPHPDSGGSGCHPTTCAATAKNCGTIPDGCGGTLSCGSCQGGAVCGVSQPNVCGCSPTTCAAAGASCGTIPDGCGGSLTCGSCTAPTTCAGAGVTNQCGCRAATCSSLGKNCGSVPDGCGGILTCGSCTNAGDTCGGGGSSNVCGHGPCVPGACGNACGTISDGCGSTLSCGTCNAPETCGGAGVANQCGCTATTCGAAGATCGTVSNGCGGTLSCGTCNVPETCGGAGSANRCGCTPETDATFCANAGATCGAVTGDDNCGNARTVASCGACTLPATCGGGGVPNACSTYSEPMAPVCSPDGWCWDNPRPQGNNLMHAVTTPSGGQWVSGASGTVLHWDGTTWSGWTALAGADFVGIWASSDTDVWVGGTGGVLMHYNGTSFSSVTSPVTAEITAIWGTSSTQIWAVTLGGSILAFDGKTWTVQASFQSGLLDIRGTSAKDIWVAGSGTMVHYDGTKWTATTVSGSYTSVWLASPTSGWAVGGSPPLRWDGASWIPATGGGGEAVYGNSENDVWTASSSQSSAWHWDGLSWTAVPMDVSTTWGETIFGITGDKSGHLLAVGSEGVLYRYVNGAWQRVWTGTTTYVPVRLQLSGGFVASPNDVYGAGMVYSTSGAGGTTGAVFARHASGVSIPSNATAIDDLFAVSASATGDVWAVGRQLADHGSGTSWNTITPFSAETELDAVTALSSTDVWVAGGAYTVHWDGGSWGAVPNPVSGTTAVISSLGGTEGGDVWAGTVDGALLRYSGGAWSALASPGTGRISSISAPGTGVAMACEANVGIISWNGTTWAPTGPSGGCLSVWVGSATDAWALTEPASFTTAIWHFDGSTWTQSGGNVVSWTFAMSIGGTTGPTWILGSGGQTLYHP